MSTATLSPVELGVLNATADDAENLEQIYKLLQNSEPPVTLTEVAETVHQLVQKGLLTPRVDENDRQVGWVGDASLVWRAWFEMTPLGRETLAPSVPETVSVPRPGNASRYGAWSDIAVDIPLDAFQETRREMGGTAGGADRG